MKENLCCQTIRSIKCLSTHQSHFQVEQQISAVAPTIATNLFSVCLITSNCCLLLLFFWKFLNPLISHITILRLLLSSRSLEIGRGQDNE